MSHDINKFLFCIQDDYGSVVLDWNAMNLSRGEQAPGDFFKCIISPLHRQVSTYSEVFHLQLLAQMEISDICIS